MKLITICLKETGETIRMGTIAAAVMVENQEAYYIKKGVFKRRKRDSEKVRAKTKSILGAKIIRKHEERKAKERA